MTVSTTLFAARAKIINEDGTPNWAFLKKLQEWDSKLNQTITLLGQISAQSTIQGHAGTIGGITANIDGTGILLPPGADFTRAYTNKNLDNIADGASYARPLGTELNVGKIPQVNSASTDNSVSSILSQSGTTATINVAAFQNQYGRGQVNYNAGSCTAPSNTSIGYVYFTDPTYAGGSLPYIFTTNYSDCFAAQGRQMVGKITLAVGGGGSGGGGGGGNSNTCFTPNVMVRWARGAKRIADFAPGDRVLTMHGLMRVKNMIVRPYDGPIYRLSGREYVTPNHLFWVGTNLWKTAEQIYGGNTKPLLYEGSVWNMEIDTDDEEERNYVLGNGRIAHNGRFISC